MASLAPIVTSPVMEVLLDGVLAAAGSSSAPAGNVFYYRLSTLVLAPTKVAFGTIFQTTVVVPLLAATNARYSPVQALLRFLDNAADPYVAFALAGAGAIATDSEPSNDAVVVRLNSAFRGKTMRGFKHFAGASEVDTTGDVLTGAGLARWQAVRNACFAPMVDALGNTWTPFIRSRQSEQVKINPTVVRGVDVIAGVLNLTVGTMRKRKTPTVV